MSSCTSSKNLVCALALLIGCSVLTACGGGPPAAQPVVRVLISPGTVAVPEGGTQTFTATVSGAANQAVTWSVQEGAMGGSVSPGGVYSASSTTGTFHVVATSVQDPTRSGSALVTVQQVSISINPTSITVPTNNTALFGANVTGTSNVEVSWSVREAGGGTITPTVSLNATYTSPDTPGTYHVVATSSFDPSKSAAATITVTPPTIGIAPQSWILGPKGAVQFTATIVGLTDRSVNWSVAEGAAGGPITNEGLYTAPGSAGTFHVQAASVVDPSLTTQSAVTVVSSGFRLSTNMQSRRAGHTATKLLDGKVLIAGGIDSGATFTTFSGRTGELMPLDGHAVLSAEIYDPATDTFSATGSMTEPRAFHTATLLPNGKVLITGGLSTGTVRASAELYDPQTGTFSATGSMANPRTYHTATLLANGQVLIVGGTDADLSPIGGFDVGALELYDPASGAFSLAPRSLFTSLHTATRLADGRVLLAGGDSTATPTYPLDTVETLRSAALFDPGTMQLEAAGNMGEARELHTATLLSDGRTLVVGGLTVCDDCLDDWPPLLAGDLFDPTSKTFASTAPMGAERIGHTATLLPDGQVLIVGGDSLGSVELFDPATESFSFTGSLFQERRGHTATLLDDGRVLVTGGFDSNGNALSSAETYK